ncbi:Glycosyltransferase, GT2 family [Mesorhizobium qingshengii]|uniref:Glycosyltransferase, GT2 family n=2 Tax=Mesorhizobium qingshengii TaxID=1165689 RepID=A0A1G5X9D9_9HYPH|nr:Glycosyltransferase, GT2 family [Mesorhizobium qingshengii]
MSEPTAAICMLAVGKPGYALAAREALTSFLKHTDFEIYMTADSAVAPFLPQSPRIHLNLISLPAPKYPSSRFLAKFDALTWCLEQTGAQIILQVDVDAVLLRPLRAAEMVAALGDRRIGMVEQTGIAGTGMTRADFLESYRRHSLAFIDASAAAPAEHHFRHFNSGVVLAYADEMRRFLDWADGRRRVLPADNMADNYMIADQDYFQVWANTVAPQHCTSLPWQWNHCGHWDEHFPRPGALIAHFSNFCNGPEFESVMAMHALLDDGPAGSSPAKNTLVEQPAELAFIIITYNSSKVIGYCLDALTNRKHEVIVIDNASTDGTLDHVTREGVTIIRNTRNQGFAAAANRAAAATSAVHLCFLNPDCLMTPAAVEAALSTLRQRPDAMVVPDYVDWHGNPTAGRQPGYSRLKLTADILDNNGMAKLARRLRRLPGYDLESWSWPLAAALFVGRDTFQAIGCFDDRYFCYMEDVAIGFEMARRGLDVIRLGHVLPHFGQHGADIPSSGRIRLIDAARLKFARLHYGRTLAAALAVMHWVLLRRLAIKGAWHRRRRRGMGRR